MEIPEDVDHTESEIVSVEMPEAMFKSSKMQLLHDGKSKQPVEGLFCTYSHRVCMQNRLESYEFCLKHILEDKNGPFKQCSYSSSKTSKRCNNAAPKSDRKEGYCVEHARRALLIRQRASRKKRPKETPETLLEGLDSYAGFGNRHDLHEGRRHQSLASKALEYASSSDSDAETPVVDQAWRGDGDSDAESIDSEQEDPLKHAGVHTAEEVALIMRDKLIRLQSLYIDQFKRLQHVMKEKRRKFIHTMRKEKESYGGLGQYAKDLASQENWYRYTAMKRYHKKFGTEALLHRQSKERRIAASEGASYKPPVYPRCIHCHVGEKCISRALPLSKYCQEHIMNDSHQVLYRQCRFGDGDCLMPVASHEEVPYCILHMRLQVGYTAGGDTTDKDELMTSDDQIDVTVDISDLSATPSSLLMLEQNHTDTPPSKPDHESEEALMKKGKLLFQHLKNFDIETKSGPSGPSTSTKTATITSDPNSGLTP